MELKTIKVETNYHQSMILTNGGWVNTNEETIKEDAKATAEFIKENCGNIFIEELIAQLGGHKMFSSLETACYNNTNIIVGKKSAVIVNSSEDIEIGANIVAQYMEKNMSTPFMEKFIVELAQKMGYAIEKGVGTTGTQKFKLVKDGIATTHILSTVFGGTAFSHPDFKHEEFIEAVKKLPAGTEITVIVPS